MQYKTFKYNNYENCSFYVDNYSTNPDAMFISILNKNGKNICDCTVNKRDFLYEENTATIKNYTENYGMTKFLLKLGIIKQVITKSKFSIYATSNNDSIDYCDINIKTLKKYSSTFNYKWNIN